MVRLDEETLYKVAYEEARRALSEQQAAIESLRSRAGLSFSAAVVTTSFLGAQALKEGSASVFYWLAMASFVGVAAMSLVILLPRPWDSTANPQAVIDTYIEAEWPARIGNLHRDLALHMHASHLETREGAEKLGAYFQVAGALLGVEVLLWIISIASLA